MAVAGELQPSRQLGQHAPILSVVSVANQIVAVAASSLAAATPAS